MNKDKREIKQIMKTELFTQFGNFFVSTMYRRSSAMTNEEMWYFETLAWNLDKEGKREKIIADNSGAYNEEEANEQHFEVCKQLLKTGKFEEYNI